MNSLSDLITPTYAIPVMIGLLLLLFFPASKNIKNPTDRTKYRILQVCTLLGAVIGAKISVLMGDLRWPLEPLPSWSVWIDSGRSITGGLIGGLIGAEAFKPLLRYPLPPNDRFAAIVPFSIGIGRSGCWMSGCCLGNPTNTWLGVVHLDGIARYPAALYEMAFHFCAGILLVILLRRGALYGHLFALYLVMYGTYRFLSEFLRATPTYVAGLSAYQFLALGMILLGLGFARARWGKFSPEPGG